MSELLRNSRFEILPLDRIEDRVREHLLTDVDRLLRDPTPVVSDPTANVAGFHLYTFNEVGRTERWRRRTIERLQAR